MTFTNFTNGFARNVEGLYIYIYISISVNNFVLILFQIGNNYSSVCYRAVWRVRDRALDLARRTISAKRVQHDELLHNIPGVRFFISAITAVEATSQRNDETIFPAVSYFIVYSPSDECNDEILFNRLHNEDTEADVVRINPRRPGDGEDMARVLFNVVKDHKNEYVNEMVRVSNGYCIQRRLNDPEERTGATMQDLEKLQTHSS